ncbi:hypothetical protein WISP_67013 [Willisornis vidua]|uniref:Uncharacterized protein n=1 Tax=Willisornis vidua TaxID=1566151 RepID=A0ABQ9DDX9_9PASS|nr:hypothetical protein WISP_67013 [Willisornis vidua]
MEIAKITTCLRKLKGAAIDAIAQYGIMPLMPFMLGKLFQLGHHLQLLPRGKPLHHLSLALRGDMNLRNQPRLCTANQPWTAGCSHFPNPKHHVLHTAKATKTITMAALACHVWAQQAVPLKTDEP